MRAKKSLGQNFLGDDAVIRRIIAALNLANEDTVVEIGPGRGALTERLLDNAGTVVAVEFDRDLIAPLTERFVRRGNLKLINENALHFDFAGIVDADTFGQAILVANLPYNLSTPILQHLTIQRALFSQMVLMFQREVVERITAPPGGKSRGFLSVLVENAFETEYLFDVPPTAFSPIPKVWSAVVRLTPKKSSVSDEGLLREIVSASFTQKRKTILNNLKSRYQNASALLDQAEIDGRRRAETVTLDEWVRLTDVMVTSEIPGAKRRES